jgi:hypothetical protein
MNDFHESDRPPSKTMSYILYSVDTDTAHYGKIRHSSLMDCTSPTGAFTSPGTAEGTFTSMNKNRNEKNHVYLRVNNTTPREAFKKRTKLHATAPNSAPIIPKGIFSSKKMQRSTASPSTIMQSADNDCVASQNNDTNKTAAKTHTQSCGRFGCPAIFVYAVGTDWPTVSRLINDHSLVCMGGFYRLSHLPPRANPHDIPHTPSPPPPAPESLGVETSNREDEVSAGGCKRRRKEDKRKEELEDDEYTEDVQPTSVRCRGCQKAISLDKRSRYYPGLWVKHRGKCPGIRKIEVSKLIL